MNIITFNAGIIWITILIHGGKCFDAGWGELLPFTSTNVSSNGTTHYAITECALLRIGADYLQSVYGSSGLENIGNSTGICPNVKGDLETITKETKRLRLNSFFRSVIYIISTSNVIVDAREVLSAKSHFDSESFTAASASVHSRLRTATVALEYDFLNIAQSVFGKVMHTTQDFYSHSNWIELGQNQSNPFIGSNTALGKYTPVDMATCRNCSEPSCARSNILPSIIENGFLTSGYFGLGIRATKPKGKCSHGGTFDATKKLEAAGIGINKDNANSDHGKFFHFEAARVAYEATLQSLAALRTQVGDEKFGRFLGFNVSTVTFVVDTTSSMVPYIELVKQMIVRIIKLFTNDEELSPIRPHAFILSPFNDPGVGPLTVTTDPEELINAVVALTASGGGDDIPELYYHGLDAAINQCELKSLIFTFTDAPGKDYYLRDQILRRALDLDIHIISFYAGLSFERRRRRRRQFSVLPYDPELLDGSDGRDLATATGGVTIGIKPEDGNVTADYAVRRFQQREPVLTINVLGPNNLTFEVDNATTILDIDISSTTQLSNFFELQDPTGQITRPDPVIASSFFQLYSIQNPISGSWKLFSYYLNKHTIELRGESPISCTTTLCERLMRESPDGYVPLLNAPLINQTGLLLATICDNLPAQIQGGSVALVNSLGVTIAQFSSSTLGQNGFLAPIEIPDADFRMLTLIDLVDGTRIQRQTPQIISPTLISIDIINQPYIVLINQTLNISFIISNRASATLDITLSVTDTLNLIDQSQRGRSQYLIDSFNSTYDQLTVSAQLDSNRTNATSSIFTFSVTASIISDIILKKITNYNQVTVYIQDKPYEEEPPITTTMITNTTTTNTTITNTTSTTSDSSTISNSTTSTSTITTSTSLDSTSSNREIFLTPLCG